MDDTQFRSRLLDDKSGKLASDVQKQLFYLGYIASYSDKPDSKALAEGLDKFSDAHKLNGGSVDSQLDALNKAANTESGFLPPDKSQYINWFKVADQFNGGHKTDATIASSQWETQARQLFFNTQNRASWQIQKDLYFLDRNYQGDVPDGSRVDDSIKDLKRYVGTKPELKDKSLGEQIAALHDDAKAAEARNGGTRPDLGDEDKKTKAWDDIRHQLKKENNTPAPADKPLAGVRTFMGGPAEPDDTAAKEKLTKTLTAGAAGTQHNHSSGELYPPTDGDPAVQQAFAKLVKENPEQALQQLKDQSEKIDNRTNNMQWQNMIVGAVGMDALGHKKVDGNVGERTHDAYHQAITQIEAAIAQKNAPAAATTTPAAAPAPAPAAAPPTPTPPVVTGTAGDANNGHVQHQPPYTSVTAPTTQMTPEQKAYNAFKQAETNTGIFNDPSLSRVMPNAKNGKDAGQAFLQSGDYGARYGLNNGHFDLIEPIYNLNDPKQRDEFNKEIHKADIAESKADKKLAKEAAKEHDNNGEGHHSPFQINAAVGIGAPVIPAIYPAGYIPPPNGYVMGANGYVHPAPVIIPPCERMGGWGRGDCGREFGVAAFGAPRGVAAGVNVNAGPVNVNVGAVLGGLFHRRF